LWLRHGVQTLKKIIIILGFLLSAVFLVLAFKDTDFNEIKVAFKQANYWVMVPMFASLFGFYWLKAVRWSLLLSPAKKISGAQLVPAMMAGAAGNNLLPAHIGELVRVYFAGKKFDVSKSTVLATLVVERLFDLITVLVIFSIALLAGQYSGKFYWRAAFLLVTALLITIVSAVLTRYTERVVAFIENRVTFLSIEKRRGISQQVVNLSTGLLALRKGKLYPAVIANSLGQWLLQATCLYFSLLAFNIDVSPMVAIIILGFIVVGLTLPTSPGFFGTIEYCYVLALTAVGVNASTAISAAVFYHLPVWFVVTVIGLLLLRRYHFSLRESHAELTGSS